MLAISCMFIVIGAASLWEGRSDYATAAGMLASSFAATGLVIEWRAFRRSREERDRDAFAGSIASILERANQRMRAGE